MNQRKKKWCVFSLNFFAQTKTQTIHQEKKWNKSVFIYHGLITWRCRCAVWELPSKEVQQSQLMWLLFGICAFARSALRNGAVAMSNGWSNGWRMVKCGRAWWKLKFRNFFFRKPPERHLFPPTDQHFPDEISILKIIRMRIPPFYLSHCRQPSICRLVVESFKCP